ncbi:bifunctional lysylphosphatidylglycerol flippase/synthetase MprF [Bacillus sp. FJAT-42376]|uniref:bifunctional lysylphosphatidylglycerol flippase/synthetase MprF n=1 Tax=Bacillus sp. FJAT-42376 TaxID=2014076 RepID=UPI000F513939|nr:bifunctional lysylphosphatidylglycerol flippase/synthetase MprF [Bacillus sp. FJAT-42376]AZB44001.1 bifunctional lysylphosphatidylglycerol flippase/synthetase MprF [Bacillus sp. FJAT-42376]
MGKQSSLVRWAKILIPFIIILFIYIEGKKEITQIDPSELLVQLKSLDPLQIVSMFLIGLVGVAALMVYDLVLIKKLKAALPWYSFLKISWIANTFNGVIGFGGLAGASLRGLLLKKHVSDSAKLLSSIVWLMPVMLTGISILAWLPLSSTGYLAPLYHSHPWIKWALWGMAFYLPAYLLVFFLFKNKKELFPLDRWTVWGIAGSLLEWLAAALVLWAIALLTGTWIPFVSMLAVFVIASIAGIISLVPGGIGSFDLMLLVGLNHAGAENSEILIILLFYRVFYTLIPFCLGLLFTLPDAYSRTRIMADQFKKNKWVTRFSFIPNSLIPNLSFWALAVLIFLSGVLLLLSAATPGILERVKFAEKLLSEPVMNISHLLSVTAGISLILLSRTIQLKVKSAYILTYIVLVGGALFTFSKGLDYEESIFLIAILMLLRLSKNQFYRERLPLTWKASLFMIALTLGALLAYVLIGYLDQPFQRLSLPPAVRDVLIKTPGELVLTAAAGFILAILFNTIGFSFLTKKEEPAKNHDELLAFLEHTKGNVLTHLALMGDKEYFWNKDHNVFMMYAVYSDKLVVLGDPIGAHESFSRAIMELREYADIRGLTPIFYQTEKDWLSLYHENGYQFFKLGEEAYVNLDEFTLTGKKKANLRAVKNKFEREGFVFTIAKPPFSDLFIEELEAVSFNWLRGRKEKGFSLGFFDRDYIQQAPVAVLRNAAGTMMAFATIMPVYDSETISIDLMRHSSEVPSGTMDMIFISIILDMKEQGYKWFNLGMAPLSNVGQNKYAFWSERAAARIYKHGQYFYQFEGIRKYKEKFASRWEPKYLAFSGRSTLPVTMLQLSRLIQTKKQ